MTQMIGKLTTNPPRAAAAVIALVAILCLPALVTSSTSGTQVDATTALMSQTDEQALAKSRSCLGCHEGIEDAHASDAVKLGCIDCHGGDANVAVTKGWARESAEYEQAMNSAHVLPRHPENWTRDGRRTSSNPTNTYVDLMKEPAEFVKFINPGDLRVAAEACGGCHQKQVNNVPKSTMATAQTFWAAASYANGILGLKYGILGEHYTRDGVPGMIKETRTLTDEEKAKGALGVALPMPRWELLQPGEYFRAFERGGIESGNTPPEPGNPNILEEAGKPDLRLSNRGRGTGLRISPAIINVIKTRLNDPHLSFLGTNDHPGDYRSSGCSACHVVYANDRDPFNSGPYAKYGHQGLSQTGDPTIPKNEKGHPLRHRLSRAIPTSQCMVCHMHQPNSFVNTYLGYTMWDNEINAEHMYPKEQKYPTAAEEDAIHVHNPEGSSVRGLWSDVDFLEKVSELNPKLEDGQFADYHGHGWIFKAVFKKDRKGNLLDKDDNIVSFEDPEKFKKAVHLKDIHLEKGMHCVDCHFEVDNHGDSYLKSEYAETIEIDCENCHGDNDSYASLRTTGPAAPKGGTDLSLMTTSGGRRRFAWIDGKLFQRSVVDPTLEWEVSQVKDSITPGHPKYNEKSRFAKTIQKDGSTWGLPATADKLAHSNQKMSCYTCHSSWITSCFGCHLPQKSNRKTEMQHYEDTETRNYASYNPQVVRSDVYMLGVHGRAEKNKIAPVRSSSALMLSSTQANRQKIYNQQTTISAPGFNGQAFNPHVPHTVRTRETKGCPDCHVSDANDNNAWMAQLLLQGTNWVNFIGKYAWVALGDDGVEAIRVTEDPEPQAVIGSTLHKIVYPDFYAAHEKNHKDLKDAFHHHGHGIRSLQQRGEYLYIAKGHDGVQVYDIAVIDNKDFSERFVSSPFTKYGQNTKIKTKYATAIALPTNMPMAPHRKPLPGEQLIHPIYSYAFISDKEEGLILFNSNTFTDGDPLNNFIERAVTFNPDDALHGAMNLTVAGNYVYMVCDRGLQIIDVSDPLKPSIIATVPEIKKGTAVAVQFRYAFVTDSEGMKVVDITYPTQPRLAATVPLEDARNVYVARTYAYVAGGKQGMVIVDVEKPEQPFVDQVFDADGEMHGVNDIKVGSTSSSLYAYVGDEHGLFVIQLTSPKTVPGFEGFSPRPVPNLIAKYHTHDAVLAVSKGLDRDRAADESGNQTIVFNRQGARPMNLTELQKLYLREGRLWTVKATPPGPPIDPPPVGEQTATTPAPEPAAGGGR
ncbi:MAG: hypothetical protein ACSLFQ_07725 [Thermoanaerobaculia bacterium]